MTLRKDDLQIPPTLRPKLTNVDATVKAAMLKSSQVLTLNTISATSKSNPKVIRKTRSADSIGTPKRPVQLPEKDKVVLRDNSPARFSKVLSSTSSTILDVEMVKKLRLLLRNESAR